MVGGTEGRREGGREGGWDSFCYIPLNLYTSETRALTYSRQDTPHPPPKLPLCSKYLGYQCKHLFSVITLQTIGWQTLAQLKKSRCVKKTFTFTYVILPHSHNYTYFTTEAQITCNQQVHASQSLLAYINNLGFISRGRGRHSTAQYHHTQCPAYTGRGWSASTTTQPPLKLFSSPLRIE